MKDCFIYVFKGVQYVVQFLKVVVIKYSELGRIVLIFGDNIVIWLLVMICVLKYFLYSGWFCYFGGKFRRVFYLVGR